MPTRRTLELMIITAIAVRPAFGLVRLWAAKTMATADPGSLKRAAAETSLVVV